MTIMNEGEIIINDKTRAGEVAQIFVAAGIYDSVEKVPVYEDDGTTPEEAGISVHEVFGDIEPALQEVADKCKEAGIILNGQSATPVTMMAELHHGQRGGGSDC